MSIGAVTLAAVRGAALALLTDRCVVQTSGAVTDDSGGQSVGTPGQHAITACLLQPQKREQFGAPGDRPTHRDRIDVSLPVGTVVNAADTIKHVPSGRTMVVVELAQPRTNEAVTRVICERND